METHLDEELSLNVISMTRPFDWSTHITTTEFISYYEAYGFDIAFLNEGENRRVVISDHEKNYFGIGESFLECLYNVTLFIYSKKINGEC